MSATCGWCKREMAKSVESCDGNLVVTFPDKSTMPSIRYRAEDGRNCHDCNVMEGGHHHPGCDDERCPKCGGQLISCGCLDDAEDTP